MEAQLKSKTVTIQMTCKLINLSYLTVWCWSCHLFVDYCCIVYYKQLLDEVFVISGIIKVEMSVIS